MRTPKKLPPVLWTTTVVAVLLLGCLASRAVGAGTPKNFREIFVGRCEEYQQVRYPQLFGSTKNCTDLWQKFYSSFAYKDPCGLDVHSYDDFVLSSRHNISTKDRTMYWSGAVIPLVYEYTAQTRRYVTIRDYLPGYIVQDVPDWCGKVENPSDGPGMDFSGCPAWGSCGDKMTSSESFWKALSSDFARAKVDGNVTVLLNGSNGQAYRGNSSTFGGFELANLNATRNPIMFVKLIHDIEPRSNGVTETCQNGTLVQLKADIEKQGIVCNCTDDPIELLYFQCVDYIGSDRCNFNRPFTAAVSSGFQRQKNVLIYEFSLLHIGRLLYNTMR